jgi:hypothetical protein
MVTDSFHTKSIGDNMTLFTITKGKTVLKYINPEYITNTVIQNACNFLNKEESAQSVNTTTGWLVERM